VELAQSPPSFKFPLALTERDSVSATRRALADQGSDALALLREVQLHQNKVNSEKITSEKALANTQQQAKALLNGRLPGGSN